MARRKIYDNDCIMVEQTDAVDKVEVVSRTEPTEVKTDKTLYKDDVISAFAGYLIPQLNFMEQGEGTCVICGVTTNSPMRTICMDCMKKYKGELYDVLMDSADGEIKIKV